MLKSVFKSHQGTRGGRNKTQRDSLRRRNKPSVPSSSSSTPHTHTKRTMASAPTPVVPALPPPFETTHPSVDNLAKLQNDLFTTTSPASRTQTPTKPSRPLRIAFFGASEITGPVFSALHCATSMDHPINQGKDYPLIESIDVITSPPVTRLLKGKKFTEKSPLAQHIESKHPDAETTVEWYSPDKTTPFRTHFEMAKPSGHYDLAIVFSFPRLIPPRIIDAFPMGMINLHPSLIPLYRGPSPMQAALGNNDPETGISIITIEPHKFDVGAVLAQRRFPLDPAANLNSLSRIVEDMGSETLLHVINNWDQTRYWSVTQDALMTEFNSTLGAAHADPTGNNIDSADATSPHKPQQIAETAAEPLGEDVVDNPYVQKRLFAPKYGSTISPDFNTQRGDEIYGLWRGLVGFRQIHAKINPKTRVDAQGNVVHKDPTGLILSEMIYDRRPPTPAPDASFPAAITETSAIAEKEGATDQPPQQQQQPTAHKRYQQHYKYEDFQPKTDVIGSAIYDPHFNAIRIRCVDNTTVLVSKFVSPTGLQSDAKAIVNGFFIKDNGKFHGQFSSNLIETGDK